MSSVSVNLHVGFQHLAYDQLKVEHTVLSELVIDM